MKRRHLRILFSAVILGTTIGAGLDAVPAEVAASSPTVAQPAQSHPGSFHQLADKKLSAVVSIIATQNELVASNRNPVGNLPPGMRDFMDRFFGGEGIRPAPEGPSPNPSLNALGSGFVIDPEGFIVTNNHVVENAEEVKVVLRDDTELPATVVGTDSRTDLALLKVETSEPLPHLTWGNSEKNALVGDWVLAIGNPFGLGGTVTAGIVSARARDIHAGPYDDFIQTDAAINRGNSGGPLIDVDGDVVGVNTAIFSPTGGNIGIGFAVPSSVAQPVVQALRTKGSVERGWLGVQIQAVTKNLAGAMGRDNTHGALAAVVTEDGPAAEAGIKPGDIILEFNGKEIEKLRDLPRAVADTAVGSKAKVVLWRDGERIVVNPTIARLEEDDDEPAMSGNREGAQPKMPGGPLGLSLAPLTQDRRERLGLAPGTAGVLVEGVAPDSSAAERNVQAGDIIVQVGPQEVTTPEQFGGAIRQARKNDKKSVALLVQRGTERQFVAIPLESGNSGTDRGARGKNGG